MEALAVLKRVNAFIFLVAISGAVLILIWLGVRYFTAKGETEKTHKFLMYVIIGLILLIIAGTAPTLLVSFLRGKV